MRGFVIARRLFWILLQIMISNLNYQISVHTDTICITGKSINCPTLRQNNLSLFFIACVSFCPDEIIMIVSSFCSSFYEYLGNVRDLSTWTSICIRCVQKYKYYKNFSRFSNNRSKAVPLLQFFFFCVYGFILDLCLIIVYSSNLLLLVSR